MRKTNIFLLFSIIVLISCSDDINKDFNSIGTITGLDYRKCMCCGGWLIDIDSETYRFHELPLDNTINLYDDTFPIKVNLDWEIDKNACLGDEIVIQRIKKVTASN